jgi:hypothetical protein
MRALAIAHLAIRDTTIIYSSYYPVALHVATEVAFMVKYPVDAAKQNFL